MLLRKILLGVSAVMLGLSANAQSLSMQNANRYNRPLGLNNVRNLPDNQLQKIGEHVTANAYPTRAAAKQMLKSAKATARRKVAGAVAPKSVAANYQASDTIFWESFEGWDGNTMPWLPESPNKWTTKSNIADLTPYLQDGNCPTWTSYKGDGYYVPYSTDADNMLVCMFGTEVMSADGKTVIAPAPKQDEWIISPSINGINKTNYLSFDICYAPWNTHFFIEGEEEKFDANRIAYDVEVLVTSNTRTISYDSADYTQVYKLSEEVDKEIAGVDLDDDEAIGQLMYMNWHHIQIPLTDYDGKNIRVAIRYTGTKGASILIDAIRVSDLLPIAKYDIPQGAFYYGFSEKANLFNTKIALVPAFQPLTWQNYSNEDAKSFAWSYISNGEQATSTDKDLLMPAQKPTALVDMPVLTASSSERNNKFNGAYYKVGGNAHYSYSGPGMSFEGDFYVGNFDPTKEFWTGQINANPANPIYAFGTGGGAFYGELSNYYYNAVDGIGNFYEKPASPYVFSSVMLPLGDFFNLGATLACTIYKVENENTITDEVIAQATVKTGQQIAGGWFLIFDFDRPLVIDDAIFILIDGFNNSNLMTLAPLSQAFNHDSGKSYAFVKLNTSEGKFAIVDVANLISGVGGGGNMNVSHCMGMNAVFPYVNSVEGDVFTVADAGEAKSFNIESYWEPKDLTISASDSWIKAETIVNEVEHTLAVKITADALDSGVKGRSGTVKIEGLGCSQTILVLQGEEVTGIKSVASTDNIDGTFTLSGQRINSADAKNGIFLVKKNGKFVKVLK